MTRGRKETRKTGERRCLVNGQSAPRAGLIRFVLSPEQMVVPDLAEKLGGRGLWLSADREAIDKAISKNLFARGFKAKAVIPEGLAAIIEAGLVHRLIAGISLMRRAGEAISGADRVGEWLQSGAALGLLQARDGSPREKRNVGTRENLEWQFEILDRNEMGQAFGRDNVVHIALSGHGLINRVYGDANRLAGLRAAKID